MSILILHGQRCTLDVSCCVFCTVVRAASSGDNVQIPWQAWDIVRVFFCVAGAAFGAHPACVEYHLAWHTLYWGHSLHFTHFTLHTLHFILHTLDLAIHTLHFTLCTPHFTLYTLHSSLYTLHFTLYTAHSTLYTLHYSIQFKSHTLHLTLRNLQIDTPRSTL